MKDDVEIILTSVTRQFFIDGPINVKSTHGSGQVNKFQPWRYIYVT